MANQESECEEELYQKMIAGLQDELVLKDEELHEHQESNVVLTQTVQTLTEKLEISDEQNKALQKENERLSAEIHQLQLDMRANRERMENLESRLLKPKTLPECCFVTLFRRLFPCCSNPNSTQQQSQGNNEATPSTSRG